MRAIVLVLVFLIGVNFIFYPRRITKVLMDTEQGKLLSEKKVLFFSPIWSDKYESKLFTSGDFTKAEIDQLGGGHSVSVFLKTDASYTNLVESARDIWLKFIFLPSVIFFGLILFLNRRNFKRN